MSADLALMPHVLVAGTTGSGKSGCINAILTSILMHASPNEVRLVLVDPKRVELNHYERVPHLLTPVVTNPRLAANVLANLIGEMESRYAVMSEARARNLVELNRARKKAGEPPLPHILCVIDELADLMMVAPAEVEDSIIRLAQKARAIGIHLVLATQRPSTDVITGTIKVNIPARIAFAVASQVDSRVILDQGGAETLLGQGDMLFRPVGTSKLQRIQGAFVTEDEIARVCNFWAKQGEPEFDEELLEAKEPELEAGAEGEFSPDQDDLLDDAARIVVESETASVSMIQRRLRVGYTRAGRLIDMLERRGIISGYEGSKPRQVLVSAAELPAAARQPRRRDRSPAAASGGGPSGRRPRPSSSRCTERRRSGDRRAATIPRDERRAARERCGSAQVLEQARARAGLDIADGRGADQDPRQVPARARGRGAGTCCRARAYAKGFLRTYAQLLGLDGDALVDEYRRQVESDLAEPSLPARRPGARAAAAARRAVGGASRTWLVVGRDRRCSRSAVGAAILVLIDGRRADKRGASRQGRRAAPGHRSAMIAAAIASQSAKPGRARAPGRASRSRSACSAARAEALIDGQVLPAASHGRRSSASSSSCGFRPGSPATS